MAEADSSQSQNQDSTGVLGPGRPLGRWQFSLRGLLLFVLLVAMGLSLVVSTVRYRQAEAELAEYRREYGILKVEDPKMLYAVALWCPEPCQRRWRVYLPPGRYDLCWATTGIRSTGFPKAEQGITTDLTGLGEVSVVTYKDSRDGPWKCRISTLCVSFIRQMPASLDAPATEISGVRWGGGPTIVSPDERLVLMRRQVAKAGVSETEAHDGLMLWIRPAAKSSQAGTYNWYGN